MAEKYKTPKISTIIKKICADNSLDYSVVVKNLQKDFPELWVKERCANCDASMAMYTYKIDVASLALLQKMGDILRKKMMEGKSFTEANKIHLTTEIDNYTLVSHQTIASKLGLITKVLNEDGSHSQSEGWLITRRGFQCLQGKPIPKQVVVFRNEIQERTAETTTMQEVFNLYKKGEYTDDIKKYSASSWFTVDNYFPNNFTLHEQTANT